jgi:F-type H+-transporting ATPase subunit epsilon
MSTPEQASAALERRLHVVIVTGDQTVYDGNADCVLAPGVNGQIGVLAHHAPLLAALEAGELVVRAGQDEESFAVGGGFIEVRDNEVIVLADTAERAAEIDVARAEAARQKASLLVKQYRERPESVSAWQALRRSRARLKVAGRRAGRGSASS